MPLRTVASPAGQSTDAGAALVGHGRAPIPIGEVSVDSVEFGIVTSPPETERPPGSGLEIINARIRRDFMGRRPGTLELLTKPDSEIVLKVINVFLEEDSNWILRITKDGIYGVKTLSAGWVAFTGPSPMMVRNRRIDSTQFLADTYLATVDQPLIRVVPNSLAYDEVAGAPIARFVTSFADRVIAANIKDAVDGPIGTKIQWSANGDPTEWDPLVNESAGSAVLDSAPSDQGDEITGLHVVGNQLIILRERSIWIGTRQPIAFAPFRFEPLVTNLGCDLPHSSAEIPNGVIFVSRGNQAVYVYSPGTLPQVISGQLGLGFLVDLIDTEWVDSAYDPFNEEFHFGITANPTSPTFDTPFINKIWVLKISKLAWTFDIGPVCSTIGHVELVGSSPLIDQLTGVIDAQVPDPADPVKPNPFGWIDDWASKEVIPPVLIKGIPTGEVVTQSFLHQHDWDNNQFEFEFTSQNQGGSVNRRTLKEILFNCIAIAGGKAVIEFSDASFRWKKQKTMYMDPVLWEVRYGAPRVQMTGNRIYFRLRSAAPTFRVTEWWVRILEKTRQRQRRR